MTPYITARGSLITQSEEFLKDPIVFVSKLLDFKAEIDKMVVESFASHPLFGKTRDLAFSEFMNEQIFTPSYLAKYSDIQMRIGLKGK